jgi:hypothetical protein
VATATTVSPISRYLGFMGLTSTPLMLSEVFELSSAATLYSGKKSGLRIRTVKVLPAGSAGWSLGPVLLPVSDQIQSASPMTPSVVMVTSKGAATTLSVCTTILVANAKRGRSDLTPDWT